MSLICSVVGARPNFMKMAPVIREIRRRGLKQSIVHTGQHYDVQMSEIFFGALDIPKPDVYLSVGSGSHADQTARVMMAFEPVCLQLKPDLVVVGGDVNSTVACALTAAKLLIPVAHVESGLRSFDRSMPEEINRVLTDHISSLLFTTEESGNRNLLREGISPDCVHFVGNSMIDSLNSHLDKALAYKPWERYDLLPQEYGLVTLHRPANVDDVHVFTEIAAALTEISREIPLVFPVHPRTRARIEQFGFDLGLLKVVEPLGYLEFLGLMAKSFLVLTDSGGVQEETTALGVPCVTLRLNTERPITIQKGTNRLAGSNRVNIVRSANEILAGKRRKAAVPELWDGHAGVRIVDVLERSISVRNQLTGGQYQGPVQGSTTPLLVK